MRDFTRFTSFARQLMLACGASAAIVAGKAGAIAPDANWFSPQNTLPSADIAKQRYSYEIAKSALAKDDMETFYLHYANLGEYPLVPYLDYSLIKNDLTIESEKQVIRFLEMNEGSFLAYKMREQWLNLLAKKKDWPRFLSYYSEVRSARLHCFALQARLTTGDNSVGQDIATLWSAGKSHPKACDPLFEQWMREDGLTNEIAWERFLNAMEKRRRGLAKYVVRKMDGPLRAYAETFLRVDATPSLIKQHDQFSESSAPMQHIIAHGIQRLAKYQPKDALYHWELYEAQQLFDTALSTETKVHLVKRLTWNDFTDEAAKLIASSQELQQSKVVEYLVRENLKQQDWQSVYDWIVRMEPKQRNSDRWQYWLARAQLELSMQEAIPSSQALYKTIAQNRSFYGFLASDILGTEYSLEHQASQVLPSTRLLVEKMPAMLRARELWLRGNLSEAQAEWHFAMKSMDTQQIIAAGHIAQRWGWYNKGIVAMITSNQWNDLDVRFPLAYKETITKVSASTKLDPNFIFAVARQESAFLEQARSSVGAMGLMQIMPATARQTARKSGISHRDQYLLDPEYNINLGSQYLTELLQQFNNNRILAIAAYNAGPHRVNRWMEDIPQDLPFDIWIETIPFKETRGYVQNVLAFSVIYAYRMGKESALIKENEIKINL